MGYGFVFSYVLILLLDKILPGSFSEIISYDVFFVLFGLGGGLLPDIDRLESLGFSHRKTLHYISGYIIAAILLIILEYFIDLTFWTIGFSCLFFGAWLHSVMDVFDGFWAEDPNKGVYEHITGGWIRALNMVPFASLWEWSLQWLSSIFVISVSPHLSGISFIPGWMIATSSYFILWLIATLYEFRRTVPRRWEMEKRTYQKLGLEIKRN